MRSTPHVIRCSEETKDRIQQVARRLTVEQGGRPVSLNQAMAWLLDRHAAEQTTSS